MSPWDHEPNHPLHIDKPHSLQENYPIQSSLHYTKITENGVKVNERISVKVNERIGEKVKEGVV